MRERKKGTPKERQTCNAEEEVTEEAAKDVVVSILEEILESVDRGTTQADPGRQAMRATEDERNRQSVPSLGRPLLWTDNKDDEASQDGKIVRLLPRVVVSEQYKGDVFNRSVGMVVLTDGVFDASCLRCLSI